MNSRVAAERSLHRALTASLADLALPDRASDRRNRFAETPVPSIGETQRQSFWHRTNNKQRLISTPATAAVPPTPASEPTDLPEKEPLGSV